MRLRKIRLVGFKSFVDPTTIAFPGNLIGIVGPNGCGKSNVIDAVRWVMGERSARHLRGESMSDVVFTGSNTRQPVSQASVELVFDNSDGGLGGRYAGWSEIAIQRRVGLEGQSQYSLNGAACRRRDVMDVFLGTGLGPRSYAIIEQGTISRLIEAKPEELRVFLEEAAGISRYRERRRETGNRIRHTQENLDRLADLREEIGGRLVHLERQAKLAERYKAYKEEERTRGAELLALRWGRYEARVAAHERELRDRERGLDAALAGQRRAEAELVHARAGHQAASDEFNRLYREVLDAGAEVARAEETIQSRRQQRERAAAALAREREDLKRARAESEAEQQRLDALGETLAREQSGLSRAERAATGARRALRQSEEAMRAWQTEWEVIRERAEEPAQAARLSEEQLRHHEETLAALRQRAARLGEERERLAIAPLQKDGDRARKRLESERASLARLGGRVREIRETLRERREAHEGQVRELHGKRGALEARRGRVMALEALQEEALGKAQAGVAAWLEERGLAGKRRLAEGLRAAPGWERALETVLGMHLQALCVEEAAGHARALESLPEGNLTLFRPGPRPASARTLRGRAAALSDHVRSRRPLGTLLHGTYAVESVDEALALLAELGPAESVVTRSGVWFGPDWMRCVRGRGEPGVLERERQLGSAKRECLALEREVERREGEQRRGAGELLGLEDRLGEAQEHFSAAHERVASLKAELGVREARLAQTSLRLKEVTAEQQELGAKISDQERRGQAARERLRSTREESVRLSAERDAWAAGREARRQHLEQAQESWHASRDESYRIGLRIESMRAQRESLEGGMERGRTRLADLETRCRELDREVRDGVAPLDEARRRLRGALTRKSALEGELGTSRSAVEGAEGAVQAAEQARRERTSRVEEERAVLERERVAGQEVLVRRKTLEEQLAALGRQPRELLEALDPQAGEEAWEAKLQTLAQRIARLGPINLAAIEEHDTLAERKRYLDAQHADLSEALTTLEAAIRKIDRETRARFRETYEKVNAGMGRMFPRLFGGGQASLQLTGEDLLDTGVAVVARPPGKRNTNVALLSGGEKALCAIALVFAIFELNPAPFCLLDEVDAPLDDANVARFCALVREMSERLQLVMVTHNKISMEIAQQLVGVTMNEPGVSRLVTVDLDAAVEMAAR